VRGWPACGLGREGQTGRCCSCGRGRSGDRGGDGDAVGGLGWREAGDGSGGEAERDHGRGPQRREAKMRVVDLEGMVRCVLGSVRRAEGSMWESGAGGARRQ